jgi:purine catabolism regulator
MEVPDIVEWVHPGELLVTTMYPLRDDAAAIDTLVPRLPEKGFAGLAVTPPGYMAVSPSSMLEAADALGFPLIEPPEKVSFIDIIQPLTSEILTLQDNELIESDEIHR